MAIVPIHGGRLHELKCEAQYFRAIERGDKTFEVRLNDRDFAVGDILELSEVKTNKLDVLAPTGDVLRVRVTYILKGGQFGIADDHVVMSVRPVYATRQEWDALRVRGEPAGVSA